MFGGSEKNQICYLAEFSFICIHQQLTVSNIQTVLNRSIKQMQYTVQVLSETCYDL